MRSLTRLTPRCDPEAGASMLSWWAQAAPGLSGVVCLAFGTGWFASSEEDIHRQEFCSVSCRVAGASDLGDKQHVPNAFGPSLASLAIRSCKHPWWEPGNCVCLSFGLPGRWAQWQRRQRGRGCFVGAPACKIRESLTRGDCDSCCC